MSTATLVPLDDAEVIDAVLVEDDPTPGYLPAVDPLTRPFTYPPDRNPVTMYLSALDSEHSVRMLGSALDRVAAHLSAGTLARKGCALFFGSSQLRV